MFKMLSALYSWGGARSNWGKLHACVLVCAATPDEDLATFVAVLASSTTFYEGEQQHPAQQQQPAGSAAPTAGNGYDHAASSVMSSAQWLSQNLRNAAATASTHISAAGVGLTQVIV
jgi:hypothetical protein